MRRRIPSLQALLCFDAAARHQSFTRAAQELSLTQGAVSRQLTALEAFLGLALFKRTRHGMALTASGLHYAQQVSHRLSALEQDTFDVMSAQGRTHVVHLAAVPTFATRWLIPRLPQLQSLHPGLTLHIDTRTRPFMFTDSPFDAVLYAGTPEQVAQWAGTQAVKLFDEVVVPVCAPALLAGQPQLSAQDIAKRPLLQQSTRPDAWRQWFDAQGVTQVSALTGARFELFSMTAAAAVHGMGLALVPLLLIEEELARGDLCVASAQPLSSPRAYYLVRPDNADGDNTSAVLLFQDWLLQEVATAALPKMSGDATLN